mmetsp:Transcript_23110/g.55723  ORF Transcript_23110/g.55723 Transcript_23110/m.55723 type:complete len:211 (+) Transcript_23110:1390-2022(+)
MDVRVRLVGRAVLDLVHHATAIESALHDDIPHPRVLDHQIAALIEHQITATTLWNICGIVIPLLHLDTPWGIRIQRQMMGNRRHDILRRPKVDDGITERQEVHVLDPTDAGIVLDFVVGFVVEDDVPAVGIVGGVVEQAAEVVFGCCDGGGGGGRRCDEEEDRRPWDGGAAHILVLINIASGGMRAHTRETNECTSSMLCALPRVPLLDR